MKRNTRSLLDQIVRNRFRSSKDLGRIVEEHSEAAAAANASRRRLTPSSRKDNRVLRGVHRGTYYRVQLPPPRQRNSSIPLPNLPKLPPPMSSQPPVAFKAVAAAATTASTSGASPGLSSPSTPTSSSSYFSSFNCLSFLSAFRERLTRWWADNWSVVVLNVGSICTLAAFTRSDVLELRSLSVVGSACSVVYQLTLDPVRWAPVLWSMLFASVNSFKIYSIVRERTSGVRLTGDQERIYVLHFLPHGLTPKQFEMLLGRARIRRYPKGASILKQGDKMEHVYLVVQGATRATILGRRVSAASMPLVLEEGDGDGGGKGGYRGASVVGHAANASAWIGEMAFLEKYWICEQLQLQRGKRSPAKVEKAADERGQIWSTDQIATKSGADLAPLSGSGGAPEPPKMTGSLDPGPSPTDPVAQPSTATTASKGGVTLAAKRTIRPSDAGAVAPPEARAECSMYTITAAESCTVLEWSHQDLQDLMERSTDLRAALTRALSSAIVGKVINFTVSKSQAHRSWSQWLDDWKNSDGATIRVQEGEGEGGGVDGVDVGEPTRPLSGVGAAAFVPEALPTHPIKKFS